MTEVSWPLSGLVGPSVTAEPLFIAFLGGGGDGCRSNINVPWHYVIIITVMDTRTQLSFVQENDVLIDESGGQDVIPFHVRNYNNIASIPRSHPFVSCYDQ